MRTRTIAYSLVMTSLLGGCALTPVPLAVEEIDALGASVAERVVGDQEPLSGPIDVHEAVARALKYNLDDRVEQMNAALKLREFELTSYSMLPGLVASSGYTGRNNDNASNSVNILTGAESLATSTSQERRISTRDVQFSWNILDFGLSYVRARQSADKYLIQEELRRKVIARIVEEVRTAYWRAVSADRLIGRLARLEARAQRAQRNARIAGGERQTSPMTAAVYERDLIEIKRVIGELQRDLSVARTQLAALMNVTPGTRFRLAGGGKGEQLRLPMGVNEMVSTALTNRPELREVWYQRRINEQELHAALLELLPGLTPFASTNYDSNDFLYNNNWLNWGAKVSWNLMKVVQYPVRRSFIEAQGEQLDVRSLAVAMAVMTQVHVSRIRFLHQSKEYAVAREYVRAQRRVLNLMRDEEAAQRVSEQSMIREELNTLIAEARRDIAYAALQNAHANVFTSMGVDLLPAGVDAIATVKELASNLRHATTVR